MGTASGTAGSQLLHHADFHAALRRRAAACTSSMKLRMKKMPRPLDLRRFSGASGSATSSGSKPSPWSRTRTISSPGCAAGREGELDGDQLVGMLAVAVLDRVDDRLAHGHADPVDGVLVEPGQLADAVADDLDEVQHVEVAVDLEPDRAAAGQHADVAPPAERPERATGVGVGGLKRTRIRYHSKPDQMEIANAIVRRMASTTDAAVVPPARRVRGPDARARATSRFRTATRCSPRWPTASPPSAATRPAPTAPPRSPACSALGVACRATAGRSQFRDRRPRPARPAAAAGAARRRQLRHHDAAACPASSPPTRFATDDRRRRARCRAGRCGASSSR